MNNENQKEFYKAYIAGYRDGIKDATNGSNRNMIHDNLGNLPIRAMGLSTRAYHCLSYAGCKYIKDVAALSEYTIATMRRLGSKTAAEIARWLDSNGICYTAWSAYL